MADDDTTTETEPETSTDQTSEETTETAETSGTETDWKAKYEATLGHSRQHEKNAKANSAAAKELAALKAKDQTDSERTATELETANARIKTATRRAVMAEVKSAASTLKFTDPGDALAMLDVDSLTNDDGEVDDAAVLSALKAIAKNKPYLLTTSTAARSSVSHTGGTGEGAKTPKTLDQAAAGHYGG